MVNIRRGYGVGGPRIGIFPKPVNAQRAPTTADINYPIGQLWVDNTAGGGVFILQRISGTATWINMGGAGGVFDNLTVNPGPTTLTGNLIQSGGSFSLTGNAASDIGTTGAGIDLTVQSAAGRVVINGGEAAADAISINATAVGGGIQTLSGTPGTLISSTGLINLDSSSAVGNGIIIEASDPAGGVAIRAGMSVTVVDDDSTALINIGNVTPSVNRDIRLGGGTVITAVTDTIIVGDGGVSTNAAATKVVNIGVGDVLLGTQTINIGTGTAASGIHDINIGTGTGGGTKSVNIGNADNLTAFTLDASSVNIGATAASNFTVTGALDLTLDSTAGSVVIDGGEAVIDAVQLTASNGAVQVTGGALAATTGLNMVQGAASVLIQVGTGAPGHTSPQGSLYLRTDGSSSSNRAYINTDGMTTWTAISTVI
jgi:trimeric autotransporter adhesin